MSSSGTSGYAQKRKPKNPIKFQVSLNEEQKQAKSTILENKITVLRGQAGSGKSMLAAQAALDLLFKHEVEKVILTRPAVTSGEEIGFLPGDKDAKLAPYTAAIYDNMYRLYNKEKIVPENTTNTRKIIYEKLDNLDKQTLEKIISELSFQGYQKIMIEAGPTLSKAFIASGLVDELIIYQPKNHRSKEKFIKDVESSFNYISTTYKIFVLENDYELIMQSA